jgi:hypothetical protein
VFSSFVLFCFEQAACAKLKPGWAGEDELFGKLVLDARVHLAAGRDFGFTEPGFFRMTFAEPLPGFKITTFFSFAFFCKLF